MKLLPHKVESYGISDMGYIRPNNEDVFRALPEKQFYILADGMGGHNAGEVAAFTAVESCSTSIQHLEEDADIEKTCNALRQAIHAANETVYTLSHQKKEYSGMGTTLSCFVLQGDMLIYAHVGDSRLYRKRQKLKALTSDHSLRHIMLTNEERPLSDLPASGFRNVITRAVGTNSYIIPDMGIIPIYPGDIYMLCSDGLTDMVSEECIEKTIDAHSSLSAIGTQLIKYALEKGGNDNITILLVKIVS